MADLSIANNDFAYEQIYLSKVLADSIISRRKRKVIKLFTTILDTIENNQFLMMTENADKNSEDDYSNQVWVPVFKALFSIHDNLIRLKTGETVPDDSTNGKATLYDSMNKVVGFKIDIRFLFDYDGYEFDLGAAEVCVPGSLDQKINDDLAKLLREGKDNTDSQHKATFGDKEPPYTWILQIVGLTIFSFSK